MIEQLGTNLIPARKKFPHQSLHGSANRLWSNTVAAQLDPDVFAIKPSLPKSKPELVFGYSRTAFNTRQLTARDLLVEKSGGNYAIPDGNVRFPF